MSAEEIRKRVERANFSFMFDKFFDDCIADIDRLMAKLGNFGKCDCGRDAVKRCQECNKPIWDVCCYSISGEPERRDCGKCFDNAHYEWQLAQMGGPA